jgi:flagellar biogenesis protein FliO
MIPFKPAEDLLALLAPAAALLVALVAAAALVLWYARRHGGFVRFAAAGRPRRLRVLERLSLSRHASLVLVEYDGRALLLGQSGERVSLLHGPEGAAAAPPDARSAADHAA